MASVTSIETAGPVCVLKSTSRPRKTIPSKDAIPKEALPVVTSLSISDWASIFKDSFRAFSAEGSPNVSQAVRAYGLHAPRRKRDVGEGSRLAYEVASLLYPAPADAELSQVIKYEKDIVSLRRSLLELLHQEEEDRIAEAQKRNAFVKSCIKSQGPWDEMNDPLPLTGVEALPMPVEISDKESLRPFFRSLSNDHSQAQIDDSESVAIDHLPWNSRETYYGVDVQIWGKGMLYADGRMDLCKRVLGPPNISDLMTALSTNTSVKHFLLGNNIIGPIGAKAIADFCRNHPSRIETWYLAGNCIDAAGLARLVPDWINSESITNIWLKRNPLGPAAAEDLAKLVQLTPNLRTLDLDQTELGDSGVSDLFDRIASAPKSALHNIYLNGIGISVKACKSMTAFLASASCTLESLYISLNPIGDEGAVALADGLRQNNSLRRLTVASSGIDTAGANTIFAALTGKSNIMTLCMDQHYSTRDLGMRYNYLEEGVCENLLALLDHPNCKLQMLDLGLTALHIPVLTALTQKVASENNTLLVCRVKSIHGKIRNEYRDALQGRLARNVAERYDGMSYAQFEAGEQRWLTSPKDVRLIDSGYRNQDAGLARRGKLVLDKWWNDRGKQIQEVMKGA